MMKHGHDLPVVYDEWGSLKLGKAAIEIWRNILPRLWAVMVVTGRPVTVRWAKGDCMGQSLVSSCYVVWQGSMGNEYDLVFCWVGWQGIWKEMIHYWNTISPYTIQEGIVYGRNYSYCNSPVNIVCGCKNCQYQIHGDSTYRVLLHSLYNAETHMEIKSQIKSLHMYKYQLL